MDELLAPIQEAFEGCIDFHGQRLAETLSTAILAVFGAIGFLVGYTNQDVFLTVLIGMLGVVVTILVVIPPWPFYNKHPEPWYVAGLQGSGITIGSTKGG